MPTITDITKQKKNQYIYNLIVDGKFVCGLDVMQLSNLGLKLGKQLQEQELADIVLLSIGSKAFNAALRYLSYRPRSEFEVRQHLAQKEYEEPVIAHTIERLQGLNYINDVAFAQSWISTRQATKPRSARVLALELSAKKVDREIVSQVLEEVFGQSGEEDALRQVMTKKLRLPRFQADKQKLIAYMMSQGYMYSDVASALELLTDDDKS